MNTAPAPMLAHKVQDHPAIFPCFVQPKLDGVRCLVWMQDDALVCTSRNGKDLHIPPRMHNLPDAVLAELAVGLVLDGELYIHGTRFQEILSIVKRRNHPRAEFMEYHVYDSFYRDKDDTIHTETFEERHDDLTALFQGTTHSGIKLVDTEICDTTLDLDVQHAACIVLGYEGSIIRDPVSYYVPRRSVGLLKRKDFLDAEYEITEVVEGVGKNEGTAVLVCRTADTGLAFRATAPGDYDAKSTILESAHAFVGKMVTIKYQELTNSGIPRFPVATGFPVWPLQPHSAKEHVALTSPLV